MILSGEATCYHEGSVDPGGCGEVGRSLATGMAGWFCDGMSRGDLSCLSKDELIELVLNLQRPATRFDAGRDAALAVLRKADVVASDETGVRIEGTNVYYGVFRCASAVVHHAAPTRGGPAWCMRVWTGNRPAVWLSDRSSAQQGHVDGQQTCWAHLARDVAYALKTGEDTRTLWLDAAFALARSVTTLAASTVASRRRKLERSLRDILGTPATCDLARDIQSRMRRARDQFLTFAFFPGHVEPTNNACERDLRSAVIQRNYTKGCRAMWSAKGEATVHNPWLDSFARTRLRNSTNPVHSIITRHRPQQCPLTQMP